jgi:uncharacterized protein (TIGR04222 family)
MFNHADWSGSEFLALYAGLLILAICLGFAIPRHLRAHGRQARALQDEQTAYLAGGHERYAELVATRLMTAEAIAMTGDKKVAIRGARGARDSGEAAVLALPSPTDWSAVDHALRASAERVGTGLVASGLLMSQPRVVMIRLFQTLPYLLLIAFGVSRWRYGNALDHPTGFLTALLILTAIFTLMRWFTPERRTRSGIVAIENAQARGERLRRAPMPDEIPLAVALFGTAVLAGSTLTDFHQMRSDSNGSADGGGGCGGGGGGCGGCGGCGG